MSKYAFSSVKDEYTELWKRMQISPSARGSANAQADTVIKNRKRYEAVQRSTGVPWFVVGCMHMRESGGSFARWLHNGDPMRAKDGTPLKTVRVPAGRPPDPNTSWESGAYDALVTIKHYDQIKDWSPERVAYVLESFNGWGYRQPSINIPSPYLWGGTNIQKRGKYIRDGVFDQGTWDTQLGGMAVLRAILDRSDASFPKAGATVKRPPAPKAGSVSPKARDNESQVVKPVGKSKTVWGTIISGLGLVSSVATGIFESLNNPYALAAFGVIVLVGVVGVTLALRGYFDTRNLVTHLSDDDDGDE
jgi:lysozyme family protein